MSEKGTSESTQWVLVVPLLLFVVLGLIQTGVWLHGRTVASNAAFAAAEQVAWMRARSTEAHSVALRIASAGGLVDTQVSVAVGVDNVRVTLDATVPTFFDVGQGRLHEVAIVPLERVTQP